MSLGWSRSGSGSRGSSGLGLTNRAPVELERLTCRVCYICQVPCATSFCDPSRKSEPGAQPWMCSALGLDVPRPLFALRLELPAQSQQGHPLGKDRGHQCSPDHRQKPSRQLCESLASAEMRTWLGCDLNFDFSQLLHCCASAGLGAKLGCEFQHFNPGQAAVDALFGCNDAFCFYEFAQRVGSGRLWTWTKLCSSAYPPKVLNTTKGTCCAGAVCRGAGLASIAASQYVAL